MYVVPHARSRGIGRALLAELEDAGRRLGYHTVRLDAGEAQEHSRVLFANTGYREIPPYNANHIAVYFGEKALYPPPATVSRTETTSPSASDSFLRTESRSGSR